MNQIGTLYFYELKKIVNRKIVWIAGAIIVLLCIFLSFSKLVSTSNSYGDTEISGLEEMKRNRKFAKNFAGRKIDDSLLQEMQDSYKGENIQEHDSSNTSIERQKTAASDDSQDGKSENGLKEYSPIYSYVKRITKDNNLVLDMDSDRLYKERELIISQNRFNQMLTKQELNYWEQKGEQVQPPFIYEYTDGWANLWQYAYMINYMLLLLLAICLSNIFSIEHLRKTDAIILSSQYGKRPLYWAKILAGITFGIISSVILFGVTAITSVLVYGKQGFGAALQIAFPNSSWGISVGESILILFAMLLLVALLYSIVIMVLSEILKNTIAAMAVPVGIMILTLMIDIPYQFGMASKLYALLPTNILTVWKLWDDRLFLVFGKYLTIFQFAPIVYFIMIAILFFAGYRAYKKYQVGPR